MTPADLRASRATGHQDSALERLAAARVLPVVVVDGAAEGLLVVNALVAGGLPVAEVTLRLPGALDALRAMARARPDALIGAGTVLRPDQVDASVEAGARFIVSPGLSVDVVRRAQELGVPVVPGVATPTDLMGALALGVSVVKLFPAAVLGGPAAVRALSGPFPGVRFVPTGGVRESDLAEYLALPAVLAVGGSWMVERDLVNSGDAAQIAARAARAVSLVHAEVGR